MSVAAFAADPSGTWTFSGGFGRGGRGGGGGGAPDGQAPQSTLVLALKDGKLTGKLTPPAFGGNAAEPIEIKNATFKDDVVSFTVERAGRDGTPTVTKFSGKLSGDTITGETERPGRDGGPMKSEWVAKKAK